jgi:hypothetical protein
MEVRVWEGGKGYEMERTDGRWMGGITWRGGVRSGLV